MRDRGRDTRSDPRQLKERRVKLRAEERGHTFERHVDIGPAGTQARAQRLLTERGPVRQQHADATRWTSDYALARAVDGVERSPEYRTRMTAAEQALSRGEPPQLIRPVVRLPLRDAVGPDWRNAVAGHRADATGVRPIRFPETAQVVAVYRAKPGGGWYIHTCYPLP